MKELYLSQYVEVGPKFDLQLKNKQIKIAAGKLDGWSCELRDHKQVYVYYTHVYLSRAVESYTGCDQIFRLVGKTWSSILVLV